MPHVDLHEHDLGVGRLGEGSGQIDGGQRLAVAA